MLYTSPIVQDLGRFLEGVLEPLPTNDEESHQGEDEDLDESDDKSTRLLSEYSIPYHKSILLDQVKRLYIIHASSRIAWEGEDPTAKSDGDELAKIDREGWELTVDIVNSRPHVSFARLQYLLLNTWDDGRWGAGQRKCEVGHEDCSCIYPVDIVDLMIDLLFSPVLAVQHVTICHGDADTPGGQYIHHDNGMTSPRIYHRCDTQTPRRQGNHSCLYMKGDSEVLRALLDNNVWCDWEWKDYLRSEQEFDGVNVDSASKPMLELYITSPGPGGNEEIPAQIKEAIEKYRRGQAGNHGGSGSPVGHIVILSGDDIPPCPACGART